MPSNLVTLVRDLQRRKARKRRALGIAEGVRLIEEALRANVPVHGALVDRTLSVTPRGEALLRNLADRAVPLEQLPERELARLADTETSQGIVAVVEPPRRPLGEIDPRPGVPVLVLDAVQDPGNVGTLLRTGFALGCHGAILLKGTADLANPKVMRAGMGATFHLPAATATEGEFRSWLVDRDVELWAAGTVGSPLVRLTPPERLALVVGNEGAGLRPEVLALARHQVTIPLARGAESLNVAVAAGIILYEVQRAR